MDKKEESLTLLDMINPAILDYEEWIHVGMVLKDAGHPCSVWDSWSALDSARYKPRGCERKWSSFKTGGAGRSVTMSTLAKLAQDQGHDVNINSDYYSYDGDDGDDDLAMDAVIGGGKNKSQIIDKNWVRGTAIPPCPENWNPNNDLINYLLALFKPDEFVAYSMQSFSPEEDSTKKLPQKGVWRYQHELIQMLKNSPNPISDYDPEVGAWIRVNPFDGHGINDTNVTDHRYVLIESDELSIEKQYTILKELELPIATLVHSGGKSLHALVKIEAPTFQEYRKRVDFLWNFCAKNSFKLDTQNRNPSRLSRMPGIMRNGNPQYLIATNIGKSSWNEWYEYIQDLNDDLPEMESLEDTWLNPPELAPELIHGVLRKGHKMLIAGPSKAGKSWSLIQLSIAIAEGGYWNGFKCEQDKVLYVNLELDRASCLNRFKLVYDVLGIQNPNIGNIDIWNLRGKSAPMDKLAPKLIRRALKKRYGAIIIDPIYKVITGDENSADQMAHFCNQFDKICTELKASTICCHHHSKGTQGAKRSGDRASGSGVFLRDPDAYIDLLPLEMTEEVMDTLKGECKMNQLKWYLYNNNLQMDLTPEETIDPVAFEFAVSNFLAEKGRQYDLPNIIYSANQQAEAVTAWRIEGTLREFASFKPKNMFFKYPVHEMDSQGLLKELNPEGMVETHSSKKKSAAKKKNDEPKESVKEQRQNKISHIFNENMENCSPNTLESYAQEMNLSVSSVKKYLKDHPTLMIKDKTVVAKE